MYNVGIFGHASDKFDARTEALARKLIFDILVGAENTYSEVCMVSGHSPLGGIDVWAEEVAISLGMLMDLKIPKQNTWDAPYGFKQRNLDIAKTSDVVHVILVKEYPKDYSGQRFKLCYHCKTSDHVKSGGCWTGKQAQKLGKKVNWYVIE